MSLPASGGSGIGKFLMRVCRHCGLVAPDPCDEPICPENHPGGHSYEEARPGAIHSTPDGLRSVSYGSILDANEQREQQPRYVVKPE